MATKSISEIARRHNITEGTIKVLYYLSTILVFQNFSRIADSEKIRSLNSLSDSDINMIKEYIKDLSAKQIKDKKEFDNAEDKSLLPYWTENLYNCCPTCLLNDAFRLNDYGININDILFEYRIVIENVNWPSFNNSLPCIHVYDLFYAIPIIEKSIIKTLEDKWKEKEQAADTIEKLSVKETEQTKMEQQKSGGFVLPCNIGEKVWVTVGGETRKGIVEQYRITEDCYAVGINMFPECVGLSWFQGSDFGKRISLKNPAEKDLEEDREEETQEDLER